MKAPKKQVKVSTETNIMIKVTPDLKHKVQDKALKNDLTMSQVIRRLLTDYVNEPQGKLIF